MVRETIEEAVFPPSPWIGDGVAYSQQEAFECYCLLFGLGFFPVMFEDFDGVFRVTLPSDAMMPASDPS